MASQKQPSISIRITFTTIQTLLLVFGIIGSYSLIVLASTPFLVIFYAHFPYFNFTNIIARSILTILLLTPIINLITFCTITFLRLRNNYSKKIIFLSLFVVMLPIIATLALILLEPFGCHEYSCTVFS